MTLRFGVSAANYIAAEGRSMFMKSLYYRTLTDGNGGLVQKGTRKP
jgi:hypothetical protein